MKLQQLWSRWRARRSPPASAMPLVTLQPVGADDDEWVALEELMQPLSRRLGLRLRLSRTEGDVVMVVGSAAQRDDRPGDPAGLADDRPVIRYARDDAAASGGRGGSHATDRDERALLQQLRALTLVRHRSPRWQATGWDDDAMLEQDTVPGDAGDAGDATAADRMRVEALPLDPELLGMVVQLMRGMIDPATAPLEASYGPAANLRLDFANQVAVLDPRAQQQLRVHRRLPRPRDGAAPAIEGAIYRELEEAAWDFGVASGGFRLLGADGDCWHRPLRAPASAGHGGREAFEDVIRRCSTLPRDRDMARRLGRWPQPSFTPAELAAAAGLPPLDVRRFLQACLFIGRLTWA